jgi:hypothetical protein
VAQELQKIHMIAGIQKSITKYGHPQEMQRKI